MTQSSLVIEIWFHDGRYHGREDGFQEVDGWPPSPARLFQALVAGVACGGTILPDDQQALRWLEELDPPRVAAPPVRRSRPVPNFVPNNDLDAKGGDPSKVAGIRVSKQWRSHIFDSQQPVLYVWDFDSHLQAAERVCSIATGLFQLGRGLDMAAATGLIVDSLEAQTMLAEHPGLVRRPRGQGRVPIARQGTLTSLIDRRDGQRRRFRRNETGERVLFQQPPKPLFKHVGYDSPPKRLYFEIRESNKFSPHPLRSTASLMTGLRAAAAQKLQDALPSRSHEIERLLIGRGAGPKDIEQRIRVMPTPSIGMEHTDPSIRRVLVEVPMECPITWRDVEWAFAGLEPDQGTGRLVSALDTAMFDRYTYPARCFRSITAVALSSVWPALRNSTRNDEKKAPNRHVLESRVVSAVGQALRHAGIKTTASTINVQREPLHRRGAEAKAFAAGSRFSPQSLWHVELRFPIDIEGPLVIGDGRFFGLGLMTPMAGEYSDVFSLELDKDSRIPNADAPALVQALRRALMSLARGDTGQIERLFSGHEADGRPDSSPSHGHVYVVADGGGLHQDINRLIVAAPWAVSRLINPSRKERRNFGEVVRRLEILRAGKLGRFVSVQTTTSFPCG